MDVRAVLDDVARIGPWFAVPTSEGEPWGYDALPVRIDQVAAALGAVHRVAASIAVQGIAARLVSMPFAAVALHGVLPRLEQLRRSDDDPWAPALPDPVAAVAVPAGPVDAADLLAAELATRLEPLYAAASAQVAISERVLRGNVVSAIGGAARVMEATRSAERRSYLALFDALIDHPALRGPLPAGSVGRLLRLDAGPDPEWAYRRRSCCLFVRVPGGGMCGDCVLAGR